MAVDFTSREISQKYDRFARWYDWVEGIPDVLGVSRLRRRLLRRASGKILEVAAGTGKNLKFSLRLSDHCPGCQFGDAKPCSKTRNEASDGYFFRAWGDAQTLPFRDKSFDTVVSSLTTCTFPNPVTALREMRRVCESEGKILLLEHGRSDREWLARWQDRHADEFAKPLAVTRIGSR
jgi:ubiquinone/menaquinone biosynthesis C-methylase UbiE